MTDEAVDGMVPEPIPDDHFEFLADSIWGAARAVDRRATMSLDDIPKSGPRLMEPNGTVIAFDIWGVRPRPTVRSDAEANTITITGSTDGSVVTIDTREFTDESALRDRLLEIMTAPPFSDVASSAANRIRNSGIVVRTGLGDCTVTTTWEIGPAGTVYRTVVREVRPAGLGRPPLYVLAETAIPMEARANHLEQVTKRSNLNDIEYRRETEALSVRLYTIAAEDEVLGNVGRDGEEAVYIAITEGTDALVTTAMIPGRDGVYETSIWFQDDAHLPDDRTTHDINREDALNTHCDAVSQNISSDRCRDVRRILFGEDERDYEYDEMDDGQGTQAITPLTDNTPADSANGMERRVMAFRMAADSSLIIQLQRVRHTRQEVDSYQVWISRTDDGPRLIAQAETEGEGRAFYTEALAQDFPLFDPEEDRYAGSITFAPALSDTPRPAAGDHFMVRGAVVMVTGYDPETQVMTFRSSPSEFAEDQDAEGDHE